jgi:hypothetical protein
MKVKIGQRYKTRGIGEFVVDKQSTANKNVWFIITKRETGGLMNQWVDESWITSNTLMEESVIDVILEKYGEIGPVFE